MTPPEQTEILVGTPLERAAAVGADIFARKGYAASTTRELSRALGITNGTFYHHFATKEDLLLRICNESLDRITEAATEVVESDAAPLEKLRGLIRAHTLTMLGDQALHKTMLTELSSLGPTNQEAVVERRDHYSALVQSVIEEGQAQGDVRTDVEPHVLVLLLLNLLNWTIFWFKPGAGLDPEDLADAFIVTYLHGAVVSPSAA